MWSAIFIFLYINFMEVSIFTIIFMFQKETWIFFSLYGFSKLLSSNHSLPPPLPRSSMLFQLSTCMRSCEILITICSGSHKERRKERKFFVVVVCLFFKCVLAVSLGAFMCLVSITFHLQKCHFLHFTNENTEGQRNIVGGSR